MSQSLVQATCPKCRRLLKIDSTMLASTMRCKFCGQTMRQKLPNPTLTSGANTLMPQVTSTSPPRAEPVPFVAPVSPAAEPPSMTSPSPPMAMGGLDDGLGLLDRYRQRRRRRIRMNLIVAGCVLAGLAIIALIYRQEISDWASPKLGQIAKAIEEGPNEPKPKKEEPFAPVEPVQPPGANTPGSPSAAPVEKPATKGNPDSPLLDDEPIKGSAKKTKRPRPGERNDVKPLRVTGYPGRALLIGVKNYLYANPVNPGYRSTNSLTQDALGFKALRQSLVRDFGFDAGQVGELSDVAVKNPTPPLKGTIEMTVKTFLDGCRPQDRVLLVFMGHAVEVVEPAMFWEERKACLVPIEAEPTDADALIPLSWLYEQLAKCRARQKLLMLDVAHYDPEQGNARSGGERMSAGLGAAIAKVPDGVQVWASCSAGEYSYQFASNGYQGSVFMDQMLRYTDMAIDANRALLIENPAWKDGVLPHTLLAPMVNAKIAERVKERATAVQTPKLYGKEGPAPEAEVSTPAPSVTVAVPAGGEKVADAKLVSGIVQELALAADHTNAINPDALPPFFDKNLSIYAPDYKDDAEMEEKLKASPFRAAIVETTKLMHKHDIAFEKGFKYPGDEATFKKALERSQEKPATIEAELEEAQTRLDKVAKERDKEPSKRWQAHYDFVYARLLAKKTYVREYNFVLGNKLKKDAPVLKDPKNNNGWVVIPTEKMQQKDTREWDAKRQKLLEKLMKEHPGTPWEVLARREKAAFLGLGIQEAKVE